MRDSTVTAFRPRAQRVMLFALVLFALTVSFIRAYSPARALTGSTYELKSSHIGAGSTSAGGAYSVKVALGQPDAGAASGGAYVVAGGFYPSPLVQLPTIQPRIYMPMLWH